jgi:hypothetical protein
VARTTRPPHHQADSLTRRHLIIGWAGLVIFLSLGIALETFHGLKLGFYLDVRHQTRRLMWTLAHTHGTLFSLVHIAFAVSLRSLRTLPKSLHLVSSCLLGALVAMPLGFFLGGVRLYGGDPGLGVFLVPIGAAMLLVGAGTFLAALWRERRSPGGDVPASDAARQDLSHASASSQKRRKRRGR